MPTFKHFRLQPDSRMCLKRHCLTVWCVDPDGAAAPLLRKCPVCGSENSIFLGRVGELLELRRRMEDDVTGG
jgi:hypothetical protein